jgi:nucleoside-diphosphate-sugar epimerase
MRILITGGNGNISKMIFKNLSTFYEITCITRNDFNLLDYEEVSNYLYNKNFDVLIHTAITGGRRTKEENGEVVYQNLLMFENLMRFADKFKLIINFDSGAIYDRSTNIYCRKEDELYSVPNDYYGFSKYLIYKRSLNHDNIVNFRIFNIFHHNEESDRFIKSCINAKKNGTAITIFQDKFFDFIYEDDFIIIIKYYLDNIDNIKNLHKTLNFSYDKKYKLSEIAEFIIGDKNNIKILNNECNFNYCGDSTLLNQMNLNLIGLEKSIQLYSQRFTN